MTVDEGVTVSSQNPRDRDLYCAALPVRNAAAWVNRRQAGAHLNDYVKAAPVQRSDHRVRE